MKVEKVDPKGNLGSAAGIPLFFAIPNTAWCKYFW